MPSPVKNFLAASTEVGSTSACPVCRALFPAGALEVSVLLRDDFLQLVEASPDDSSIVFVDYKPQTFRRVREHFGVRLEEYAASFRSTQRPPGQPEQPARPGQPANWSQM